jgi:hypothetical protein
VQQNSLSVRLCNSLERALMPSGKGSKTKVVRINASEPSWRRAKPRWSPNSSPGQYRLSKTVQAPSSLRLPLTCRPATRSGRGRGPKRRRCVRGRARPPAACPGARFSPETFRPHHHYNYYDCDYFDCRRARLKNRFFCRKLPIIDLVGAKTNIPGHKLGNGYFHQTLVKNFAQLTGFR